jgi:hypothetical protein
VTQRLGPKPGPRNLRRFTGAIYVAVAVTAWARAWVIALGIVTLAIAIPLWVRHYRAALDSTGGKVKEERGSDYVCRDRTSLLAVLAWQSAQVP